MVCDFTAYGDLLTVEDVSEALSVSGQTVRSFCRSGQLPSVKIGRRFYVPKKMLQDFMEAQLAGWEVQA